MQKVSKQSLAMLALSILLAISIALTFTFAALNSTKIATGTITFTGEVGLIYTNLNNNDGNLTFNAAYNGSTKTYDITSNDVTSDKTFADVEVKLAATSVKATIGVTLTYNATDSTTIAKYVKLKADGTNFDKTSDTKLTMKSGTTWNATAGSVKVNDILELVAITEAADIVALSEAATNDVTFVIKFTATKAA